MSETEAVAAEHETATCVWCQEALDGEATIVGPTERFPDSDVHAWTFHDECAEEWATCLRRLERLARAGGRHTLVDFPLRNGVDQLHSE